MNLIDNPMPLIEAINEQAEQSDTNYDAVEEWRVMPDEIGDKKYFTGGIHITTGCWEKITVVGRPALLLNASRTDDMHYPSILISWKPFIGPTVDNNATFASMTVSFCDIENVTYDDIRIITEAIKGLRAIGEIRLEAI